MGTTWRTSGAVNGSGDGVDEIRQAVTRIQEQLDRLAEGYEGLRGDIGGIVEAKIEQAFGRRTELGGASAQLVTATAEIRGLCGEASAILRDLSADIKTLVCDRSNDFIDSLGPDNLR